MADYTVSRKIRSRFSGLLEEQTQIGRRKGGSLFERLTADEDYNGFSLREGTPGHIDSIKRNLRNILNSRIGHSQATPYLGLGDFNDSSMGSADLNKQIQKDIIQTVMRYEPRISDIEVEYDKINNSSLDMHFSIKAKVPVGNGEERVIVDIILENGSYYRVL